MYLRSFINKLREVGFGVELEEGLFEGGEFGGEFLGCPECDHAETKAEEVAGDDLGEGVALQVGAGEAHEEGADSEDDKEGDGSGVDSDLVMVFEVKDVGHVEGQIHGHDGAVAGGHAGAAIDAVVPSVVSSPHGGGGSDAAALVEAVAVLGSCGTEIELVEGVLGGPFECLFGEVFEEGEGEEEDLVEVPVNDAGGKVQ